MSGFYCKNCKTKPNPRKIDNCVKDLLSTLKQSGLRPIASCCGHNKYPSTVIIEFAKNYSVEIFSGLLIPRKSRFYKKDKQGIFYLPECAK